MSNSSILDNFSISDLAKEFAISGRTIRFYEEKGLLSPKRSSGNQRIYNKADRSRLKLILKGKHLGLRLDEMVDILGLTSESNEVEQMHRAIEIGKGHLSKINKQIEELLSLKKEILEHGKKIGSRLKELGQLSESQKAFLNVEIISLKDK